LALEAEGEGEAEAQRREVLVDEEALLVREV